MPASTPSFALGFFVAVTLVTAHAAEDSKARPENSGSLYLKCSSPNEPDGVNDLFIDFKKKTIADNFGTIKPFREEGPVLIADTYVDDSPKKAVVSTTRINRYTLEVSWLSPALKIHKTSKCVKVDRQL